MQVFVELSDNSSSINPQQTVKICNSAVAQHSIVASPAVCALNGALFGLSWLVRFTFEFIQCCQSGWPKTTALKKQFPHSLHRNHKSPGRITQKSHFLHLIQRLLKQPTSKHFDRCPYLLHPFGFWIFFLNLYFYFMRAADLAKAGVIVHGKVIIAAGTEMERRWADHPPATSACGCDTAINPGPRFNSVTKERSVAPARFERGVLERLLQGGARWGRNVLFQPFCDVIQRAKVSVLPHLRDTSSGSASSMTDLENMNCLCF